MVSDHARTVGSPRHRFESGSHVGGEAPLRELDGAVDTGAHRVNVFVERVVEVERIEAVPLDRGEVAVHEARVNVESLRGRPSDAHEVLSVLDARDDGAGQRRGGDAELADPDPTSSTRVSGVGASSSAARSATRAGVQKTWESARTRGG